MNKHIGGKLSDLVKINEQFARSTRIDKDDINQFGFIGSESIDNFLKGLSKISLNQKTAPTLGQDLTAAENRH